MEYSRDGVSVRPVTEKDLIYVANHMREDDRLEAMASDGSGPMQALSYSCAHSSECYTVDYKGIPAAIFGIVPPSLIGYGACIWALTTNDVCKFPRGYVKVTRFVFNEFLTRYPFLCNWVDARYKTAIKWLKLCGAKLSDASPYGPLNMPFNFFLIEKE